MEYTAEEVLALITCLTMGINMSSKEEKERMEKMRDRVVEYSVSKDYDLVKLIKKS